MKKILLWLMVCLIGIVAFNSVRAEGDLSFGEGSYTVGGDLPSGLYTFTVQAGGAGELTITIDGALAHQYAPKPGSPYAVFLPDGAKVKLSGKGGLTNKTEWLDITGEGYAKGARCLVGAQLVSGTVYISVAPGAESGYFIISNFENEIGGGLAPERVDLLPGLVAKPFLEEGQFIELVDCVIREAPGNG